MKNIYFNSIVYKLKFFVVLMFVLLGSAVSTQAQVNRAFTQRTSQYTPTKKIYNVKGDFTMLGNTCLTPQNYTATTNNNGQSMVYVDSDNDPTTFNSSSSTLVLSTENSALPECSNIIYAGLYWTGKSSANATFNVTKQVANGTQTLNSNLNIVHNQNITNTNYTLSVSRGGNNNNYYPIYTFSGNGNTYAFSFFNSSATNRVTLSVNGGAAIIIPVTVNGSGTTATLTTPYTITDGSLSIKVTTLIRNSGTNLSSNTIRSSSNSDVNVSGTAPLYTNVTKTFNKRIVSLKGPNSTSYTQITAATNDIYYPSGTQDDIYSAYAEITDYVKTNGIGQYTVADMALLEGDPGGTGYSGGWGIIVVYENPKMKWRDVTIFDGYAYVQASNTTGFDLPVSGFNTVQSGNVGVKLGMMASEGDVSFTGDYFRIRNLNTTNYTDLSHTGNSTTNFFNSSINAGGTRTPNLVNNTGIDIAMFNVENLNNSVIGNNQTSTNFKYGTTSDTYSIFTIAMSVDAYIPEPEGIISATAINNTPAVLPYTILPNQDATFNVDIKNLGTEPITNFKVTIPIPYNATYVPGSAVGTILYTPMPTPNTITFNPNLGATGSLVWEIGTLPLTANANNLLAKLSFKLKSTTDCTILSNSNCGSSILVEGSTSGTGATTGIVFNGVKLIQGYVINGICSQLIPIPESLSIAIDGAAYVQEHCGNTPTISNFSYCSTNTTVGTSEIASHFPAGSLFYNEFPVTINSIQYSDANPLPLIAGSTVTYYAIPPRTISGCNFPFTISKCGQIVAQDDTISGGNGTTGNANAGNVLSNNGFGTDTYNGSPVSIGQVNLTVVTPATSIGGNPVPTINPTNGQISVPTGTPAGVYTIVYQLCEQNNISNCDSATVTITCTAPVIDAVNDAGTPIAGAAGGQVLANVLTNDLLNGSTPLLANVNLTQTATTNAGVTLNTATGSVNVAPGTPSGTYTVTYQICEKINPSNCDTALVTVTVTNAVIDAVNDNGSSIVGLTGGQVLANVLANDTLNGNPVVLADVNLTQTASTNAGITLNTATGSVNVAPGTPSGTYTLTYQICEIINPTNCDSATVTVTVTNAVIDAVNDNGTPIGGSTGGQVLANVLANDTLNGNPVVLADVNLTQTASTNAGITLNTATGSVNVAPGTPSGTYTLTYQICEILNPSNCDSATVTVTVTNAVIDAIDDTYTNINCTNSGSIGNVLSNDSLNGSPVSLSNVSFTILTGNTPNISIDNLGNITVSSGVAAGTYTFTYKICELLNPTDCDSATISIQVEDTTNPVFDSLPAPSVINCPSTPVFAIASAHDSCGTVSLTYVDQVSHGSCDGNYTVTRTWTAVDISGNTSTLSQTITVQDTTAPTWSTTAGALDATVECSDATALATAQAAAPTATDGCGTIINYTKVSGSFVVGTCPSSGTYTNTWTATDACGNTSTVFTQTITVQDTTGPVLSSILDTDIVTTCNSIPVAPTLVFTDNCSTVNTPVFNETQTSVVDNEYSIIRTWYATDSCNNSSITYTQTVHVKSPDAIDINVTDEICNNDNTITWNLTNYLPEGTPTGGTWVNEDNVGSLTGSVFNAYQVSEGNHTFSYTYDSGSSCPQTVNVIMPVKICIVEGCNDVFVHNAFTPNNDGVNEYFQIDNIDQPCHLPNSIEIYNRWGVLVFEGKNYDNESVIFTGLSNGRSTVQKSAELPAGTYFYILQYSDGNGNTVSESKYLYLTR